jgi:hypothetical protein
MKQIVLICALLLGALTLNTGCNRCQQCHGEMLGVKGPSQEYCGEQLEQAKTTPGMVCE